MYVVASNAVRVVNVFLDFQSTEANQSQECGHSEAKAIRQVRPFLVFQEQRIETCNSRCDSLS
jgi:hypothetical protein